MPPRAPVNLSTLRPNRGSQHHQKRVGRGQGSGYGRTAGRGMNGQNSRSGGGVRPGFEGGQTPITKLMPKRGFTNPTARTWAPVNLDRIQSWINQGRLSSSPESPITPRELLRSGCIHQVADGVKILASGQEHLSTPLYVTASRASKTAIKAIESSGGKVVCKYYNPLALRDCVKGRTDRMDAAPTRREDIVWYSNFRNRGYLSEKTLDHGPSVPWIQPRWRQLAGQLTAFKQQKFDGERGISSK